MRNTKHFLALLLVAVLFVSCDKEYNAIGTGLVDEDHFQLIEEFDAKLTTTQINFGKLSPQPLPVQTDNLSYNMLGYYKHPVYGGVTANVISQVALSEYGKDFGENPVITKVVLSVPYFSTITATDFDTEVSTYDLDSVYTTDGATINLKIYRSEYFLNDLDASGESQKYYSDGSNNTVSTLPGLEDALLYENSGFTPSDQEVFYDELDDEGVSETIRLSPRLRDDSSLAGTNMDIVDFDWLIDPVNETALSSVSNFKEFYRGVYLKATSETAEGVLLGLDLSQSEIEVFYTYDDPEGGVDPLESSIKILFSGKKVNTFDNTFSYPAVTGSTYLNGGQGAMMAIDLFTGLDSDNDGVSDKFEALKNGDILINEASLEFYVDQSTLMGGENEPERLFLYDMKNNKTLLDYQFDVTSNSDTNLTQLNHLGKLERDGSDEKYGVKYKLRITEHITDLIRNDSTNVKLGLGVTNNVLAVGVSDVKGFETIPGGLPESIFSSSVNSHRGTVLYNEDAVDDDKKLKLKIYYTEADPDGIDNN